LNSLRLPEREYAAHEAAEYGTNRENAALGHSFIALFIILIDLVDFNSEACIENKYNNKGLV
jgi:hypothetical protein